MTIKRRFLLPWEMKYTVTCPQCGGKIETIPLWHWEKLKDKAPELQTRFCHTVDSRLIRQIPILGENDWRANQKWEEYKREFLDDEGLLKSDEAVKYLFIAAMGPPGIFLKHGIFAVVFFFTETEVKALFLLLCMKPQYFAKSTFFLQTMQISKAYTSIILKKFDRWKFIDKTRPRAEGRARARALAYALKQEVRDRFDRDLREFDFFRNGVKKMIRPIALSFTELAWREDLGLLDREI